MDAAALQEFCFFFYLYGEANEHSSFSATQGTNFVWDPEVLADKTLVAPYLYDREALIWISHDTVKV